MSDESNHGRREPWTRTWIGKALADYRRNAGLTGSELGKRVDMSQSKISRLENGLAIPTRDEIEKLAAALGLSSDETRQLLDHAAQQRDPLVDWRLDPEDIARRQNEIASLESATRVRREFSTNTVVGLLQTSEYARGIITSVHEVLATEGSEVQHEAVLRAVTARMARQQVLAEPGKQFRFIMHEVALRNSTCPPAQMLAQLQRVRDVVEQRSNLSVAFVPMGAPWPMGSPSFSVFDDAYVLIDLPNSAVMLPGAADVRLYRRLFDMLEKCATTDVEPILDQYIDMYYKLARPARSDR